MTVPIEARRRGLDYLHAVSALLNRIRVEDPLSGLFEAAELQWWWAQVPRSTDDVDQIFWFDAEGRPVAAAVLNDFGSVTQLDPILLPDATPEWTTHVMDRGLAHAAAVGFERVGLEVDQADDVLAHILTERGFEVDDDGLVESWMPPASRPAISPLPHGYCFKICFEPGNAAAKHLYLSCGFEPDRANDFWAGPTS